jgi:hypothetical protein
LVYLFCTLRFQGWSHKNEQRDRNGISLSMTSKPGAWTWERWKGPGIASRKNNADEHHRKGKMDSDHHGQERKHDDGSN